MKNTRSFTRIIPRFVLSYPMFFSVFKFVLDKLRLSLTGLMTLITLFCFGQDYPKELTPPSPNAASLGIFGQIPVSLFNGLPQISIPVGKVSAGNLTVDISLAYHGGGIRPDLHPGWVGLGWSLNAGGVITRKMNGNYVDEFVSPESTPVTKYSYYDNYNALNNNDWYSEASLQSFTNITQVKMEPSPDEYIFNFGAYSGSFYYNHEGKWKVKSEHDLDLKIEEELKNDFILPTQGTMGRDLQLNRIFYKFTLTTPDGVKYVFGGTPQSIEFTRSTINNPTYVNRVVASSWYLTKIITAVGREINFSYDRGAIMAVQSSNLGLYSLQAGSNSSRGNSASVSTSIINPVYLNKIEAEDHIVTLARSVSNELPYNYDLDNGVAFQNAAAYIDLSSRGRAADVKDKINWYKLDSISFYSKSSGFLRKTAFSYLENNVSRLMLNSIQEIGTDRSVKAPYLFSYNQTPLPVYNSGKLDHWGFYNGRNYFDEQPKYQDIEDYWRYTYIKSNVPAYAQSKSSNFLLMAAGNLTSVKYPTGGSTNFEYEPHEYSKVAKRYPFLVEDLANVSCGGLRVSKISDVDETGVVNVKEYKYLLNYNKGGKVSSGILAGNPVYLEEGKARYEANGYIDYWYWYDHSIEPLSFTNGNHVTYSEVVEKLADGSYTIYNYSNHDQQRYRDIGALAGIYTATSVQLLDPGISLELDRGKLLKTRVYKLGNVIQKANSYKYDERTRGYEGVRIIDTKQRPFSIGGTTLFENRVTAYLAYTLPRFLSQETDSLFDHNGQNPISKQVNYFYDNPIHHQVTRIESTNSGGQVVKVINKYPNDKNQIANLTAIASLAADSLIQKNMLKTVLENEQYTNGILDFRTRTNYKIGDPYPTFVAPENIQYQTLLTGGLETRMQFNRYNNYASLLEAAKNTGLKTSYVWGYNSQYVVAEFTNSAKDQIAHDNFEESLDGDDEYNSYNLIFDGIATYSNISKTGKRSLLFRDWEMLTTISKIPAGIYKIRYWSKNGQLSFSEGILIGDGITGNPDKEGWSYNEVTVKTEDLDYFKIYADQSGTTILVDDISIYPENAQVTTYTYDPVVGMTSQTDLKGETTYYEYDSFQRLKIIRDNDGNIIKDFKYNYKH